MILVNILIAALTKWFDNEFTSQVQSELDQNKLLKFQEKNDPPKIIKFLSQNGIATHVEDIIFFRF